jgi:TonB family protein
MHCAGMKPRSNRVLAWAIAISLAFHAILLSLSQNMTLSTADDQTIAHMRIEHRSKPLPPPATPKPRVAPAHASAAHRPSAQPARVPPHPAVQPAGPKESVAFNAVGLVGPSEPGASGNATGSPEPTAPPSPSCPAPNVPAKTIDVVTPSTPQDAADRGVIGTATIKVSLSQDGVVVGVSIFRSAGDPLLDLAAERAAEQTTYSPEIQDCMKVGGDYLFTAEFQAN